MNRSARRRHGRNVAPAALWTLILASGCAAIDRSSPPLGTLSTAGTGAGGASAYGGSGTQPNGGALDDSGQHGSPEEAGSAGDAGEAAGGAAGEAGAANLGGAAGEAGAANLGPAFTGTQLFNGLVDGYYSLSASVTKSGAGNCYISVKDYGGGPERMTSLPLTSGADIIVRGVHVTAGHATVGAYQDSGTTECTVRHVQLTQDDLQYEFLKGGDATEVTRTEDSGAIYRETDGTPADPFVILKNHGYNIARLRLYNDPGNSAFYPSSEMPPYAGPSDILSLARRAKAQGLMIELTFHYSDYWTNAGTQCPPHDWAGLTTFSDMKAALSEFTADFMQQMADQGTTPEYVSIGNESNGGLLYPFGCAWKLAASSYCPSNTCTVANWSQLGQLYGAAYSAVKSVSPSSQVIIHLAYDNGASSATAAASFNSYFNQVTANGGNYDIKGLTYYPFWSGKLVSDLVSMANLATAGTSKPLLIMESGYNWNPTRQDGTLGQLTNNGPEPYPSTPEGQKDFLLDLYAGIKRVNAGKCLGALYWDPLNIIKNSQVSNTALFDFAGTALPGLDAAQFNN